MAVATPGMAVLNRLAKLVTIFLAVPITTDNALNAPLTVIIAACAAVPTKRNAIDNPASASFNTPELVMLLISSIAG